MKIEINNGLIESFSTWQLRVNRSLWANNRAIKLLDKLCLCALTQFVEHFFFAKTGQIDLKKAYARYEAHQSQKCQLEYILRFLKKYGVVKLLGDNLVYLGNKNANPFNQLYQEVLQELPEYRGVIKLIKYIIDSYPDFFSLAKNGLQVLFPDGTNQLINRYLDLDTSPYSNASDFCPLIAGVISSFQNVKVVEIGGGAGLLTWKTLSLLTQQPSQYLFTDISRRLTLVAKRFAEQKEYAFMDFAPLNISCSPENSLQERFDVVLAYNVIHATSNVLESLLNVKSLLRSGGVLILVELYSPFFWEGLVWGMTEGWWIFNDQYRLNQPTLGFEGWKTVLKEAGFRNLAIFPTTDRQQYDTGIFIYQGS